MKAEVEEILGNLFDDSYEYPWPNKLLTHIRKNDEFYGYFSNGIHNGSGATYPFMFECITALKSKNVLELGNREGMGSMAMFEAVSRDPDAKLTSIDVEDDLRFVPQYVKDCPQVNFLNGDVLADEVLQKVIDTGPVDFIFFDTLHTKEHFEKEWLLYEPLLADQCLVLIDDLNYEKAYEASKQCVFDKIKNVQKISDKRLHASGFGVVFYDREVYMRNDADISDEEFWDSI